MLRATRSWRSLIALWWISNKVRTNSSAVLVQARATARRRSGTSSDRAVGRPPEGTDYCPLCLRLPENVEAHTRASVLSVAMAEQSDPSIDAMSKRAERDLMQRAFAASFMAYAPRSKFFVGAAVRTLANRVHIGCNVENDSYGLTSSAERNAVFAAVGDEGEDVKITTVALWARSAEWECVTVSPCGACRQVLAQFSASADVIFLKDGSIQTMTLADLLPAQFELKAKSNRTWSTPPS